MQKYLRIIRENLRFLGVVCREFPHTFHVFVQPHHLPVPFDLVVWIVLEIPGELFVSLDVVSGGPQTILTRVWSSTFLVDTRFRLFRVNALTGFDGLALVPSVIYPKICLF
jgi:hypothetical protein